MAYFAHTQMSTHSIKASYTLGGTRYSHTVPCMAIGPDHARLIVINSILRLWQGATEIKAEAS